MPDQHAYLSPSASKLWIHSPACWYEDAPELTDDEQAFIDSWKPASTAADEGTLGHEIVERMLRREYRDSKFYKSEGNKGRSLRKLRQSKYYSFHLQRLAEWCFKQTCEIIDLYDNDIEELYFEKRVSCKGIHKELWGTSDVVIKGADFLHVVDFKFGRLPIHSEGNPQLRIYGYGALSTLNALQDIKLVRGTILQPRNYDRSDMKIRTSKLKYWMKRTVKPAAKATYEKTGVMQPSIETCRYCKHRVTDKFHRDYFLSKIGAVHMGKDLKQIDIDELEDIAANAAVLHQWLNDVTAFVQAKAYSGTEFTKVKLVRGKTWRSFKSKKRVMRKLKRAGYQRKDYMKPADLKGIGELEALTGKTEFNELLGKNITMQEGKPRLVNIDSKEQSATRSVNEIADEFGL